MTREEAIEIIRRNMPSDKSLPVYEALHSLIPELAESEDEKARKWIYDFIRNCPNESFEFYGGVGKKAVLAYLEKQKDLDKMIVVYPEVWDKAISDAFENGKKEGIRQKEQKPAWSEEDEKMLRTIISDGSRGVELDSKQISFLKSLRPSWKPSEEQMYILNWVANILLNHDGIVEEEASKKLQSLYNDLKKLM